MRIIPDITASAESPVVASVLLPAIGWPHLGQLGAILLTGLWQAGQDMRDMVFFVILQRQRARTATSGESVETGVEVHNTGDIDDKAASGSCCVFFC